MQKKAKPLKDQLPPKSRRPIRATMKQIVSLPRNVLTIKANRV
jgi:hypothetical protein